MWQSREGSLKTIVAAAIGGAVAVLAVMLALVAVKLPGRYQFVQGPGSVSLWRLNTTSGAISFCSVTVGKLPLMMNCGPEASGPWQPSAPPAPPPPPPPTNAVPLVEPPPLNRPPAPPANDELLEEPPPLNPAQKP